MAGLGDGRFEGTELEDRIVEVFFAHRAAGEVEAPAMAFRLEGVLQLKPPWIQAWHGDFGIENEALSLKAIICPA